MKSLCKALYIFYLSVLTFTGSPLFSQEKQESYKIAEVSYQLQGRTDEKTLKRNIKIDCTKIFSSRTDFEGYIDFLRRKIENTRLFGDVNIFYTEQESKEKDKLTEVHLIIQASESSNVLILPKPSYSSNTGAELEIKLKDKNFLGTMEGLDFDIKGLLGTEDNPDDFSKVTIGANLEYTYPFILGISENEWSNIWDFAWLLGEPGPEFSFESGLESAIPFGRGNYFKIHFTQSAIRDSDYDQYDDTLYFVEEAGLALPIRIGQIDYTDIIYSPFATFTQNWDNDGISILNEDLLGPYVEIGHEVKNENVNWVGNLRQGWNVKFSQSFTWNFKSQEITPLVSAELLIYKAFKNFGINSDIYFYSMLDSSQNTCGEKVRGILDKEKFKDSETEVFSSQAVFLISLDIPIHIITTSWLDWGQSLFGSYEDLSDFKKKLFYLPHKVFEYADFELQLSPFADIALTHNQATGHLFSPKEGFYTAGFELLVYPKKWKSFVVRLSSGWDLSKSLLKDYTNTKWRNDDTKAKEVYFGLSLQY